MSEVDKGGAAGAEDTVETAKRAHLAVLLAEARARITALEDELARRSSARPVSARVGDADRRWHPRALLRRFARPVVRRLRRALVGGIERDLAELRAGQERIERWCGLRDADGALLPSPPTMEDWLRLAEAALVSAELLRFDSREAPPQ